jgi:hypothetical protein
MPLTYSGRLVKPGGSEHPSLMDIAIGLSRQPRFAGQCRRWWSVLDHTLFCDELVKAEPETSSRELRLAVLLHDAHEAITADVPTDMKGPELKQTQRELDEDILNAYFPGGQEAHRCDCWGVAVKDIDRRALCAEARVVGPPTTPERILELFGVCEETHDDTILLNRALSWPCYSYFARPPLELGQTSHPAVREYLNRTIELM